MDRGQDQEFIWGAPVDVSDLLCDGADGRPTVDTAGPDLFAQLLDEPTHRGSRGGSPHKVPIRRSLAAVVG